MEKLKMHSPNLTQDNVARIRDLFPGCVTEAKGEDGSTKLAVDFDQLRQELSESIVEGPQERYQVSWPGKREALLAANAPISKTLRPCRKESVCFDTTKNLFIEGDNLDALKLLQETYLGKVKMIYIDPPYNTGNDFIYEDDFSVTSGEHFVKSNERDENKNRLVTNTSSNGRFHSDWLSMMYSRLKLARNLLKDDGMIFISIDDNECVNLRKLCDEIYGEDNFIDCIIWKKRYGGGAKEKYIVTLHEYILIYSKNKAQVGDIYIPLSQESIDKYYKLEDENLAIRGKYRTHPLEAGKAVDSRPNLIFPIKAPDGSLIYPKRQWYWSKDRVEAAIEANELEFLKAKDGGWSVHTKQYLKSDDGDIRSAKFMSVIDDVYSQHGTNEILKIFNNAKIFPYPKPTALLKSLMQIGLKKSDDIFLDFFAGSGSSAHALWDFNVESSLDCKFIIVQLPEPVPVDSDAFKAGYYFITDITKARLNKVRGDYPSVDTGYRVLKVGRSNMAEVYYSPDTLNKDHLDLFVDNFNPDSSPEDLLFQVMLDWGVDLMLPISKHTIQGKDVLFVDGNALAACFDNNGSIDEDFVKELAKHQPLRWHSPKSLDISHSAV